MALRLSEIEKYSIKIAEKMKCLLKLDHAFKKIDVTKIFLDVKMHQCSVKIIMANGMKLSASMQTLSTKTC